MHRQAAHRRDHESGDVLAVAERLDVAQRLVGLGERHAQHRVEAPVGSRQRLLGEPAVIGPAQLDLHLGRRMQADREQHGRKQAGIIDAHRVHPAMAELDVAQLAVGGLLRRAHRIARDAAAHVLEADLRRHQGLAALGAAGEHELAQHLVLDEGKEFVVALVLVMVAVDVDDQDVVELALVRLPPRMGEQPAGVELLDRHPSAAIGDEVHGASPDAVCRGRYNPNTHTMDALPCIRSSGVRATRPRLLRGSGPPRPSQHRPEAMAMYCLPFTA